MILRAGTETLHLTPFESRRIGVALALLAHEATEAGLDG